MSQRHSTALDDLPNGIEFDPGGKRVWIRKPHVDHRCWSLSFGQLKAPFFLLNLLKYDSSFGTIYPPSSSCPSSSRIPTVFHPVHHRSRPPVEPLACGVWRPRLRLRLVAEVPGGRRVDEELLGRYGRLYRTGEVIGWKDRTGRRAVDGGLT